jgi:hypothetical protein
MTQELIREVHRQIFQAGSDAFRDGVENFHVTAGGVKFAKNLLAWIENKGAEILGRDQQEEIDE